MSEVEASLRRMVECFNSLDIPYFVMGGLAIRIHALPRPTYDVDFTISIERDRLPIWFNAVEESGYTVPNQYRSGWVDSVSGMPIVKIRTYLVDGHGVDVDVFLAESDFQKSAMARRQMIRLDEFEMSIVSPEDLVLLKLIANRPRNLIDVQDLLFIQGKLDENYLQKWATALGVGERLQIVLAESN
jgi:hypothetical protein